MPEAYPKPQRLSPPAAPGALLKRHHAGAAKPAPIQRARAADAPYLARVRACPCLKCGLDPAGEAAHVRMNSPAHGKRQAMGKRPDDRWALPLCAACHTRDPDSQHKLGEAEFWHRVGLNPLIVCAELYAVRDDPVVMRGVVVKAIAGRTT